jgi:hypothetical protein
LSFEPWVLTQGGLATQRAAGMLFYGNSLSWVSSLNPTYGSRSDLILIP